MSQALLDAPARNVSVFPDPRHNLAALTENMAELRFQILLTARWERSHQLGGDERKVLRGDLARLNKQYSDKIDEIAMRFGVQQAMKAQKEVEHRVQLPAHIAPSPRIRDRRQCGDDPQI